MKFFIEIAGVDCIVNYDAKVTARAYPGHGPTYSSGGEPPSPMEFEITIDSLETDAPKGERGIPLELPNWLRHGLECVMQDQASVYDDVAEMEWEQRHGDPDAERDRRLDDSLSGGSYGGWDHEV